MIFLDALLPHPGRSWLDTLPAGMADQLIAAAVDDALPPWPRWLPTGVLERLIPDASLRCEILAEAIPVPLSYVRAPAPVVDGWSSSANLQFIQLSEGYAGEAEKAVSQGYEIARFDRQHLAMVTSPGAVADLLVRSA